MLMKNRKKLFPHGHKDCLECEAFVTEQARKGYVELAEDQSLPDNPIFNASTNVEFKAFVLKAGWRKVELEE